MDLILILSYIACATGIFNLFHIPVNRWSMPTAVLGGAVLVGGIIVLMNYNHPYANMARNYYASTPIYSLVRGRVLEVPVKPRQLVKKGEVLFRIESERYEQDVAKLTARLTSNRHYLTAIEARIRAATLDRDRAQELMRRELGKQRDLDVTQANVDDLVAQRDLQQKKLEDLQAQLNKAKFDLAQTVVYAPTDGYVLQLALRPGMVVHPYFYRPALTFVHQNDTRYIGWFWQNNMQRLSKGDEAEIVVDGVPGRVFKAEVVSIIPAMAASNVQAIQPLLDKSSAERMSQLPVTLKITDPDWPKYQIIAGASGQAAIYTEHFSQLVTLRKILLRMTSWLNYLFPFH